MKKLVIGCLALALFLSVHAHMAAAGDIKIVNNCATDVGVVLRTNYWWIWGDLVSYPVKAYSTNTVSYYDKANCPQLAKLKWLPSYNATCNSRTEPCPENSWAVYSTSSDLKTEERCINNCTLYSCGAATFTFTQNVGKADSTGYYPTTCTLSVE